ncbi:MAG: glycerophosphodiester phosphodiesterase [Acidimicrobiales bacterium]|nr:glycerophosphodiester phosphodiesterase [Acidimicrobiales bacterium]
MTTTEPILFAHRGGRAHAPENTMEAFRLAIRLGATGLESDVWCSADGTPVLHHDGKFGRRPMRRSVSSLAADDLPPHIPTVKELLVELNHSVPLSLDVKDPKATAPTVDLINSAGFGGSAQLWLCHPDHTLLASWRDLDPHMKLVHSTRIDKTGTSLERHAVELVAAGINAINLPEAEWSRGLVALFRRLGLRCLGWNAQHQRQIDRLLSLGLDGIYGDHVDRLVEGVRTMSPSR